MEQQTGTDWLPARVKYELELKGSSIAAVGRALGYAKTSAYDVLRRPMPKVQVRIGAILNLNPAEIWPSRYQE